MGGKTVPVPCVPTAFVAKTVPVPCVPTAFVAKTVPVPCVPTAFVATAVRHCLCRVFPLPLWLRQCLCLAVLRCRCRHSSWPAAMPRRRRRRCCTRATGCWNLMASRSSRSCCGSRLPCRASRTGWPRSKFSFHRLPMGLSTAVPRLLDPSTVHTCSIIL